MNQLFWSIVAWIVCRPGITDWIIRTSMSTPYFHLTGYMGRWWFFNAYVRETKKRLLEWIPVSIRVHHIMREDLDLHEHNHPWDARTIIMRGWYIEQRLSDEFPFSVRTRGYTGQIKAKQFHRIDKVSPGGVWTLFIMYKFRGAWGFNVDGKFIPYTEYDNKRELS